MRSEQLVWCLVVTMLSATPVSSARAQEPVKDQKSEQTVFDAEPDSGDMHIKRPVEIPDSALQVLRDGLTDGVFNCLKTLGATPEQAPASWFLASAVHLNGPKEVDLIVLPNVPNIAKPRYPGGCMLTAYGGRFWVLGPGIASGRYELLLATQGGRLEVLNSRTNFYNDIQIDGKRITLLYKFSLQQYQLAEKKSNP